MALIVVGHSTRASGRTYYLSRPIPGHKLVVLDSCYDFVRFAGRAKIDEGAVRRDQAAIERRRHLLVTNGWKIEGKKGIVGHGGCGKSVVRVEDHLDNEFLHDFNELRHTRQPRIGFGVNIPD